jgi:hypothetical protein
MWGVPVGLMGRGMIFTIVLGKCERSAFMSGVYLLMMSW